MSAERLEREQEVQALHDAAKQGGQRLEAAARGEQAWLDAAASLSPWQTTVKRSFLHFHMGDEFEISGAARRTCSVPFCFRFETVLDKDSDTAKTESGKSSSDGSSSCGFSIGEDSSCGLFSSGFSLRLSKGKRDRLRRWVVRTKVLIMADPRAFDVECVRASLGERGGKHDSAVLEIVHFHKQAVAALS
jgi:hypothetical protein